MMLCFYLVLDFCLWSGDGTTMFAFHGRFLNLPVQVHPSLLHLRHMLDEISPNENLFLLAELARWCR